MDKIEIWYGQFKHNIPTPSFEYFLYTTYKYFKYKTIFKHFLYTSKTYFVNNLHTIKTQGIYTMRRYTPVKTNIDKNPTNIEKIPTNIGWKPI